MELVPGVRARHLPSETEAEADLLIRHLTHLHTTKAKLNGDKRPTLKCTDLPVQGTPWTLQSWKIDEFSYGKPNKSLPTDARGLFTLEHEGRQRIVVRGYDKFFNTDEVAATRWQTLEETTTGPYDLTLKSNGCIIFLSTLPNGQLLVTSKHSLGGRPGVAESHAQRGEFWVRKHLAQVGKTEADLAKVLQTHGLTAVAELCDDAFEEHILAYPPELSGLYLHGLNLNAPRFMTYPAEDVARFARHFGMFTTQHDQRQDLPSLRALLDECSKSGTYQGTEVEGFVIRTRRGEHDFFFKYKFEEPYLLFRQWREVTKQLIAGLEPVFKRHATITREYIHFVLPIIRDDALAERYKQNHGIIELRQRFLAYRGGDLTEIINNPEPIVEIMDTKNDWFVLVPIATIGCGKTTLALALERLFSFGHVQNDNILAKKASFLFAQAIYEQLHSKRIVFADRNNHMFHERKSLAYDLTSLRKVRDPALHLVALSFEQTESTRTVAASRVLARGDNHQSIRADTQGAETVLKIMDGFHHRFQALDVSKAPDSVFRHIVSLDPCQPARVNLEIVVRWLVEQKLVEDMPSEDSMDDAVAYALDYKPDVVKHVAVHETQQRKQKAPKVTYFGLAVQHPALISDQADPVIEHFKRNGWLQDKFHITLIHRTGMTRYEDVWQFYASKRESETLQLKIQTTHLVNTAAMAALVVDHASVPLPFTNAILHITLGTIPPVNPVNVNSMLERWRGGDESIRAVPCVLCLDVELQRFY